jgi:hypothetical protein
MKLFEDEVYKEMDWLEAACQPVRDDLNDALALLDDEIDVEFHMLISWSGRPSDVAVADVLYKSVRAKDIENDHFRTSYSMESFVKCFEFQIEGTPTIDFINKKITNGNVKLVKVKDKFTEEEIEKRLATSALRIAEDIHYRNSSISHLNEMCELLGLYEARKQRSKRCKTTAIREELTDVFKKNKWNIKDVGLSCRVATWLKLYIEGGNLAALSNFCKLKVMTHSGQPIYSISNEEEV